MRSIISSRKLAFIRIEWLRLHCRQFASKGVTYTAEGTLKSPRTLKVYRWNPDDDENPRVDSYVFDADDCGPMVLDALLKVKNELDSTLTFAARAVKEYVAPVP